MVLFLAQSIDLTKIVEKPAIPTETAMGQVLNTIIYIAGLVAVFVFLYYSYIKPKNEEKIEKQKFEYEKFKLEKEAEIQKQIDLRFKAEQENKDSRAKYYSDGYQKIAAILEENTKAVRDMCVRSAECKEANYNAMETFAENNERLTASIRDLTKEIVILCSKNGVVRSVHEGKSS